MARLRLGFVVAVIVGDVPGLVFFAVSSRRGYDRVPGAGYLHWQSVILKAHGIGSTNCRNSRRIAFFRAQITPRSRTDKQRHPGQPRSSNMEADLFTSQRQPMARTKPATDAK